MDASCITVHDLGAADPLTLEEQVYEVATLRHIARMWEEFVTGPHLRATETAAKELWQEVHAEADRAALALRDRMISEHRMWVETSTHTAHIHRLPQSGVLTVVITERRAA